MKIEEKSGQEVLSDIINLKYEDFVKELGDWANDPKLQAAIKAGKKDGKLKDEVVKFSKINIKVSKLIPTQNEIDVDKSLAYPLSGKSNEMLKNQLLSGVSPTMKGEGIIIKQPIIVLNGKYIIDGHHRWSQLYAVNAHAVMTVYNMAINEPPINVLKAVQLAIAAKTGDVPVNKVDGKNLMVIKKEEIVKYVVDTIADSALAIIEKTKKLEGKDAVAEYIWSNVEEMRKTSQPIKDAPDRSVMPQTDSAEGGNDDWKKLLQYGAINFKEPLMKEALNKIHEKRIHALIQKNLNESRVFKFGEYVHLVESEVQSDLLKDMPKDITTIKDIEKLFLALAKNNQMYHFDDDPHDIEIFSQQEADVLEPLMDKAFGVARVHFNKQNSKIKGDGLWDGVVRDVVMDYLVFTAEDIDKDPTAPVYVHAMYNSPAATVKVPYKDWLEIRDTLYDADGNETGDTEDTLKKWLAKQPKV